MNFFKRILLIFIFICTGIVFGQDSWNIEFVSRFYSGPCNTMTFSEDYCYMACGDQFIIMDVSEPNSMIELGRCVVGSPIIFIHVFDNKALVISEQWFPSFIDISNPNSPYIESFCFGNFASDLYVADNNILYNVYDRYIRIYDISSTDMNRIGTYRHSSRIRNIMAIDNLIYIYDSDYNLVVLDASESSNIVPIGTFDELDDINIKDIFYEEGVITLINNNLWIKQIDVSNPELPFLINEYILSSYYYEITLKDNVIYYLGRYSSSIYQINILDLSNIPQNIKAGMAYVKLLPGPMTVNNGCLYIASQNHGLQVYDISHSKHSPYIYTLPNIDNGDCFIIKDTLAYIGGTSSLYIVNVANPESLQLISELELINSEISDMVIENNYLYYIQLYPGILSVIDISNPLAPVIAGSCSTQHRCRSLNLIEDVILACGTRGMDIIDISNPVSPEVCTTQYSDSYIIKTILNNDEMYAYVRYNGILVFNISDPYNPVIIDSTSYQNCEDQFFLFSHYMFIELREGYKIIDIENPDRYTIFENEITNFSGFIVYDDIAYIYTSVLGFMFYDFSSPLEPEYLGNYRLTHSMIDFTIRDSVMFVLDEQSLSSLEIDFPLTPEKVFSIGIGGMTDKICAINNYLIVQNNNDIILVYDISSPTNPVQTRTYETENFINDFYEKNGCLYVDLNSSWIALLDFSREELPVDEKYYWLPADDFVVRNYFIYMTNDNMKIMNISDSLYWSYHSYSDTCNTLEHIDIHDDFAFCTSPEEGLYVYSIRNPSYTFCVKKYSAEGLEEITIKDDYAFIVNNTEGLQVYDISNPYNPFLVRTYADISYDGFKIYDNYGVFCDSCNISIYDITNPEDIVLKGFCTSTKQIHDFCLNANYIYATTLNYGIFIFDITEIFDIPIEFEQENHISTNPNPFKNEVSIGLPKETCRIEIYDIYGRLCHSADITGYYLTYTWQPLDNTPNGVYYIRAFSDSNSFSGKVVYIK